MNATRTRLLHFLTSTGSLTYYIKETITVSYFKQTILSLDFLKRHERLGGSDMLRLVHTIPHILAASTTFISDVR